LAVEIEVKRNKRMNLKNICRIHIEIELIKKPNLVWFKKQREKFNLRMHLASGIIEEPVILGLDYRLRCTQQVHSRFICHS
jgi:hypothetical protein